MAVGEVVDTAGTGDETAGSLSRALGHACLIAPALILVPLVARAVESSPATSERAVVTLVSETASYRQGQDFRLGLHFRIAPGWHIYWQNPGDAGTPPDIAWTLPSGARAGEIQWPAPVRVAEGPVVGYAYTGDVVLPVTIAPVGDGPLSLEAEANWLVCQKICVPEAGHFQLTLPPGTAAPAPAAPLFAAADARHPRPSPFVAHLAPDGRLTVTGEDLSPATVQDAWFFPAAWGGIDQNAPQPLERDQNRLVLRLKPGLQFQPDQPLAGVLALRDPTGNESFLDLTAEPVTAASVGPPGIALSHALLLALAGGLILNLMPCVFPVLAMKALAIARLAGGRGRTPRSPPSGAQPVATACRFTPIIRRVASQPCCRKSSRQRSFSPICSRRKPVDRPDSPRFHRDRQQRPDRSARRFARQGCGAGMDQRRLPIRRQVVSQRRHAAVAARRNRTRSGLADGDLLGAWRTRLCRRTARQRAHAEPQRHADACPARSERHGRTSLRRGNNAAYLRHHRNRRTRLHGRRRQHRLDASRGSPACRALCTGGDLRVVGEPAGAARGHPPVRLHGEIRRLNSASRSLRQAAAKAESARRLDSEVRAVPAAYGDPR